MHLNGGFTKVALERTLGSGLADGGIYWDIPTDRIPREHLLARRPKCLHSSKPHCGSPSSVGTPVNRPVARLDPSPSAEVLKRYAGSLWGRHFNSQCAELNQTNDQTIGFGPSH